jgi:hypothetical protein
MLNKIINSRIIKDNIRKRNIVKINIKKGMTEDINVTIKRIKRKSSNLTLSINKTKNEINKLVSIIKNNEDKRRSEIEMLNNKIFDLDIVIKDADIEILKFEKNELNDRITLLNQKVENFKNKLRKNKCCICFNSDFDTIYDSCGHTSCYECALRVYYQGNNRICPLCRRNINKIIKIYN